jgi:HNH endonuclease
LYADTPCLAGILRTLAACECPRAARRNPHIRSRAGHHAYACAVVAKRSRRARFARRRKRRLDRVVNDLSDEEWAALKAAWKGCAYCGATDGPLQRDCVMAISRGGRYTVDNVVPACATCNASKCNDEVTSWLRRKRLDERTFLTRYIEIRAAIAIPVPQAIDENAF